MSSVHVHVSVRTFRAETFLFNLMGFSCFLVGSRERVLAVLDGTDDPIQSKYRWAK